jgi:hypothetical protein
MINPSKVISPKGIHQRGNNLGVLIILDIHLLTLPKQTLDTPHEPNLIILCQFHLIQARTDWVRI